MLLAIAMLVTAATAQGPPSDAEVMRALTPATRGVPFVVGEFRDDVVVVKHLLKKGAVGPRVDVPGVGPARVVEAHWECVAYYARTVEFGFPFAGTTKKSCVQVLYIDKHTLQADAKK